MICHDSGCGSRCGSGIANSLESLNAVTKPQKPKVQSPTTDSCENALEAHCLTTWPSLGVHAQGDVLLWRSSSSSSQSQAALRFLVSTTPRQSLEASRKASVSRALLKYLAGDAFSWHDMEPMASIIPNSARNSETWHHFTRHRCESQHQTCNQLVC